MFTNILQYIICNRLYQWTPSLIIASLYYLKYSKFLFRQWVLPSKEKVIDLLTKFTPSINLTCLNYEMSFAAFKSFIRGSLFFLGQPLWKIFLMAWWVEHQAKILCITCKGTPYWIFQVFHPQVKGFNCNTLIVLWESLSLKRLYSTIVILMLWLVPLINSSRIYLYTFRWEIT